MQIFYFHDRDRRLKTLNISYSVDEGDGSLSIGEIKKIDGGDHHDDDDDDQRKHCRHC